MTPGGLHRSWEPLKRLDGQPGWEPNPMVPVELRGDEVWGSDRYQCIVRYAATQVLPAEWESAGGEWRAECRMCEHWIRGGDQENVNGLMVEHMREHQDRRGLLHLSIHANDRGPMRNWRHLQQIKNEVAGEIRTAVEIFPREDQLTDTSNEYHLWVLPEGIDLPFGIGDEPLVSPDEADVQEWNDAPHKGRQEGWEPGLTTGRTEHSREARERLAEMKGSPRCAPTT